MSEQNPPSQQNQPPVELLDEELGWASRDDYKPRIMREERSDRGVSGATLQDFYQNLFRRFGDPTC